MNDMSYPPTHFVALRTVENGEEREASAAECITYARLALEQAVAVDPRIMKRLGPDVRELLHFAWPAFWQALDEYIRNHPGEPTGLDQAIEREASFRLNERLIIARRAARQAGYDDVRKLVRALVAIAAESDVTTRAAALAALGPQIRALDTEA